jgi:signal transduction histidine kinase
MDPPRSLRHSIQSATVLAVLAGYALLLILKVSLNQMERRQSHQRLISLLSAALIERAATPSRFRSLLAQQVQPDLQVALLAVQSGQPPRLEHQGGRFWLSSVTPIRFNDGHRHGFLVRQDVTFSIERQMVTIQWLTAAAGSAALVTAALMRPVLNRSLMRPLHDLSAQLAAYRSPPHAGTPINQAALPQELQPIAAAFNSLQERLAHSWERQRSFVDGVAHELRTPITLISGHAQSLQRQEAAAPLQSSLALISGEARRMGAMVSDMLDLARQDAGRLEFRLQAIDVEMVLLDCYERLAPSSQGRLRLALAGEDGGLPPAAGDRDRLEQCLVALVDNARRYSSGPVSLSAAFHPPMLVLHVSDQGPGVRPEERELIFDRFVRGSAAVGTRGSGIGLAVVQLLMRAMGGDVAIGEVVGGGADFQLLLPAHAGSSQQRLRDAADPPSA